MRSPPEWTSFYNPTHPYPNGKRARNARLVREMILAEHRLLVSPHVEDQIERMHGMSGPASSDAVRANFTPSFGHRRTSQNTRTIDHLLQESNINKPFRVQGHTTFQSAPGFAHLQHFVALICRGRGEGKLRGVVSVQCQKLLANSMFLCTQEAPGSWGSWVLDVASTPASLEVTYMLEV